jgi:hypothetical protein
MATRTIKYIGPLYQVELITGKSFIRDAEVEIDDTVEILSASLIDGAAGPPEVFPRDDGFEEILP